MAPVTLLSGGHSAPGSILFGCVVLLRVSKVLINVDTRNDMAYGPLFDAESILVRIYHYKTRTILILHYASISKSESRDLFARILPKPVQHKLWCLALGLSF
jgi:hypothetical protein